jgi:hypothetical protein
MDYKKAGVDIEEGYRAAAQYREMPGTMIVSRFIP